MIVCHCHAVSDRTLRQHIREGACDLEELAACTGAGTGCGGCVLSVEHILEQELAGAPARGGELAAHGRVHLPLAEARAGHV